MSKTDALRHYVHSRYGDVASAAAVEDLYQGLLAVELKWGFRQLDADHRRAVLQHIGAPSDRFDWRDVAFTPGYRISRLGEAR